jgi:hypothetical protein
MVRLPGASEEPDCLSKYQQSTPLPCICSLKDRGRAMAQAVSDRPLTAEALVRAGLVNVGFVVDKLALEHVFLRVLRYSPVSIIPPRLSTD